MALDTSSNGPIAQAYQATREMISAQRQLKVYVARHGAEDIDPRLIAALEHLNNTATHLRNVRRELDVMAVSI